MIMTASTLYEAVEPNVIWRQLLSAFVSEITGDGHGFEVRGVMLLTMMFVLTLV